MVCYWIALSLLARLVYGEGCKASDALLDPMVVSTNGDQFVMNVAIRNNNKIPISGGWIVSWTLPSGYTIKGMWNADQKTQGNQIIAQNQASNGVINPGEAQAFGFVAVKPSSGNPDNIMQDAKITLPGCDTNNTPDIIVDTQSCLTQACPLDQVCQISSQDPAQHICMLDESKVGDSGGVGTVQTILEPFNFVIGTQTIAPKYQFTSENSLVESARVIKSMGSNLLKFNLNPAAYGCTNCNQYNYVGNMRDRPEFKTVLDDRGFTYYMMWVEQSGSFLDGVLTSAEFANEKQVMFSITTYLLDTYAGTGKMFMLGNWESDWQLVNEQGVGKWDLFRKDVPEERIVAKTQWLKARQAGVDEARAASTATGVNVYHYVEVNLVETAMWGYDRVTNRILRDANVDLVSYSAYDVSLRVTWEEEMTARLHSALDFIKSNLPDKTLPNYPFSQRVFIGEFGFPHGRNDRTKLDPVSESEQDQRSRVFMKAAIRWGCPFVLQWQLYDNEYDANAGKYSGFWLIDDKGRNQQLFNTYKKFYADASSYIGTLGRYPTEQEFQAFALKNL
eukprot:CFRG6063T1